MSSEVQTSPVLQERKSDQNTTKKRIYNHHRSNNDNVDEDDGNTKCDEINDKTAASVNYLHQTSKTWSSSAKKRKKVQLPNKFLLGGSITDPLNLNGLLNDKNSNLSQTPKSSPLPTPSFRIDVVDVILRPNIKDPLNLEGTYDEDKSNLLTKRTNRKYRRSISKTDTERVNNDSDIDETNDKDESKDATTTSNLHKPTYLNVNKRRRTCSQSVYSTTTVTPTTTECKITSTSAGTPIADSKTLSLSLEGLNASVSSTNTATVMEVSTNNSASATTPMVSKKVKSIPSTPVKSATVNEVKFIKNGFKFKHGNYNRYYGYRNASDDQSDHRLDHLKSEWFKDKSVLDIGCNVGHVTLHIAKTFEPKQIVGIDIDAQLIFAARKNIRHYVDKMENENNKYPISFQMTYGSLMTTEKSPLFPNNILFMQQDYVPTNNDYLERTNGEYDFILALSITKWIHLNSGDEGLKRFFKKIYLNLKPGGCLLLEPQSWSSYKKKAKLTKDTYENYKKIKFRPDEFTKYLLSKEIGFSTCKTIATAHNKSKGFRRPILLYTKLEDKTTTSTPPTIIVNSTEINTDKILETN